MDTLTHTVLGACMGEVIGGRKLGRAALAAGAVAHNFPDIDVVSAAWLNDTEFLFAHRGFTHSFPGIACETVLLVLLGRWIFRKRAAPVSTWVLLVSTGLLTHIVTDALTTYGTGWFEPFSHARVSFNVLFILDPFFMLLPLIATVALLFVKRPGVRKGWAITALVVSFCYVLLSLCIKWHVSSVARENLAERQRSLGYTTSPAPLSNLLWYVAAHNEDSVYMGYYSLLDENNVIRFRPMAKYQGEVPPCQSAGKAQLERFSKGYFTFTHVNDTILFADLRFGLVNGWKKGHGESVFRFYATLPCSELSEWKQAPIGRMEPGTMRSLIDRIAGHDGSVE